MADFEGQRGLPEAQAPRLPFGLSLTSGLTLLLIGLWGCLSIYNAKAFGEFPLHFAGKQLGWLALGLGSFLLASKIPFGLYRTLAPYGMAASLLALLGVLEFGSSVNGMKGWFPLPGGLAMFQPSEFAKIPFMVFLSVVAANAKSSWRVRFAKMGGATLAFMLLVGAEPDFGTATIFFAIFAAVYWIAGGELLFAILAAAVFAAFGTFFVLCNDYAIARFAGFFDPNLDLLGNGWHVKQFQYTMAHGGLFGSNWGNALWSNAFLPLPHSDSVFASIVESAGFAGGMLVIGGFMALPLAARKLAQRTPSPDAKIFIFATGAVLAIQALLHISVNATMIPPTGITLPILSYGGSSLLSTMILFGIAISACKDKPSDAAQAIESR